MSELPLPTAYWNLSGPPGRARTRKLKPRPAPASPLLDPRPVSAYWTRSPLDVYHCGEAEWYSELPHIGCRAELHSPVLAAANRPWFPLRRRTRSRKQSLQDQSLPAHHRVLLWRMVVRPLEILWSCDLLALWIPPVPVLLITYITTEV